MLNLAWESGVAETDLNAHAIGSVKIGYEVWRARTIGQNIGEGDHVTVVDVAGVTLVVRKEN